MSAAKNGGAAFPRPIGYRPEFGGGEYSSATRGMSLRAYLAARAMPVLLASDLALPIEQQGGRAWVVEQSYKMADDMIAAGEAE